MEAELKPDTSIAEPCAWCGANLALSGNRRSGRVLCRECGAFTISPWPDAATLDAAYAGAYRPASGRFSGPGDRLLAFTRARLASGIDKAAPPGGVLDVGAGAGSLVAALRRRGRAALGLERPDGAGAAAAEQSLVTEPSLDGPLISDAPLSALSGKWAAVVFWHSLEHLPRPALALREAVELLPSGGLMAIAVPNASSLQASAFGDEWLHLDPPRHLTHLSSSLVQRELERLGLRVERVSYWRGGQVMIGWLHGLVRVLPGRPSLYDALRRPQARWEQMDTARRASIVAAAIALAPLAAVLSLIEIALRRGGTVYIEARRGRAQT
jgi:SAM-dependent methyltransferase